MHVHDKHTTNMQAEKLAENMGNFIEFYRQLQTADGKLQYEFTLPTLLPEIASSSMRLKLPTLTYTINFGRGAHALRFTVYALDIDFMKDENVWMQFNVERVESSNSAEDR